MQAYSASQDIYHSSKSALIGEDFHLFQVRISNASVLLENAEAAPYRSFL